MLPHQLGHHVCPLGTVTIHSEKLETTFHLGMQYISYGTFQETNDLAQVMVDDVRFERRAFPVFRVDRLHVIHHVNEQGLLGATVAAVLGIGLGQIGNGRWVPEIVGDPDERGQKRQRHE